MPILPKTPAPASWLEKLSPAARKLAEHGPDASSAPQQQQQNRGGKRRSSTRHPPQKVVTTKAAIDARRQKKRDIAAARRTRQSVADAKRLERLTQAIHAAGGTQVKPKLIPAAVWRIAWQIVGDATGAAARVHIRAMRNRIAASMIIEASIGAGDVRDGRTWASLRTRRIAALGLMLVMLADPTRRRGRWNGCVKGVPRGALAAALADPLDDRAPITRSGRTRRPAVPSITAVFGTHRPDSEASYDEGYFPALVKTGLCYRQQLDRDAQSVEAYEKNGPSGHTTNRYWIVARSPDASVDDPTHAELLKRTLDAATVLTQWEHEHRMRTKQPSQAGPPAPH